MAQPTLQDPGFAPELHAQADQIAAIFASKPVARAEATPPPQPDNGVLTDIGHGFTRGFDVELPTLLGKALKAPGQPGDALYDFGQGLQDRATQRGDLPANRVTGVWGEAASAITPALAALPLGAIAGPAAVGALFGGSQFTDTHEAALAAGATPEEARNAALQTAAIQGVGQTALAFGGSALFRGAAGPLSRAMGGELSAQGVLNAFAKPTFLKPFAAHVAENAAVQVPTQAAAAAGVAHVEREAGIKDVPDSWDAAKASLAPTLAMSALLSPLGAYGVLKTNRQREALARQATTPPPADATEAVKDQIAVQRMAAVNKIAAEMRRVDPTQADEWRAQALQAVNDHQPIALDAGFKAPEEPTPPSSPVDTSRPPLTLQPSPQGDAEQPLEFEPPPAPDTRTLPLDLGEPALSGSADALPFERVPIERPTSAAGQEGLDFNAPVIERRGSAVNQRASVEDATARLQAAAADPAPGQGTALALGIADTSALVRTNESGTSYSVTKQQRVKWLKDGLGSAPSKLLSELSSLEPHQLADVLQQVWHEKGGERANQAYIPRIEALYRELTGKDIRELAGVAEGSRGHFQLAQPNAEELAQRQREASAQGSDAQRLTPQEKAALTKRQGNVFAEPKPLTKEQQKRQENVAKLLTKEIDNEATTEAAKGTKPNGDAAERGSEAARSGEQVREGQGDGQPGSAHSGTAQDAAAVARALGADQLQSADSLASNPITSAVVRFGGKEYDGPIHAVAINAARKDGQTIKINRDQGDRIDLFRRKDGSVMTKAEAEKLGSATLKSEEMPHGAAYKAERAAAGATTAAPTQRAAVPQKNERAQANAERRRVAAEAVAERRVADIEAVLTKHNGETAQMQAKLRDLSAIDKPNKEQVARKYRLETEINARLTERDRLTQLHSDALGKAEDVKAGQFDPTERTAGYWLFSNTKWDQQEGTALRGGGASNLQRAFSYAEARQITGTGTKDMRRMLENTGLRPRTEAAKQAAAIALSRLSAEDHARYEAHIAGILRAYDIATGLEKSSGKRAIAIERSATKEVMQTAMDMQRLASIEAARKEGRITNADAIQQMRELGETVKSRRSDNDEMNRGITGLNDRQMRQFITLNDAPNAADAMALVARNHSDPLVRFVAKLLGGAKPNTAIVVVENPSFDGARYIPSRDQIEVGRGGMNALTMMHETTHALVHKALGDALADQHRDQAMLTPKQRDGVAALKTIQQVMNAFRQKADLTRDDHRVALESEHEFVAEALNNPAIQKQLGGRAGLLTRVFDAIRRVLGIPERNKTEFEKLLRASTDLFGDPRHDSLDVFQRAINGTDDDARPLDPKNSPRDAAALQQRITSLSNKIMSKAANTAIGRDLPMRTKLEGLKWVTLNHTQQLMDRTISRTKELTPGNAALHGTLDTLNRAFGGWKEAVDQRRSENMHLVNGKGEAQEMQRRLIKFQTQNAGMFDRMTQMARDAKSVGVYPGDKTLAAAQRRNPNVTQEMFDHPVAQRTRAEFERLKGQSPEAVQMYDDILQKHRLDHARSYASKLALMVREFQMHQAPGIAERFGDLDWVAHKDLTHDMQEDKLRGAIRAVQGKIDDLHRTAMGTDPEGKATKDATVLKTGVDSLLKEYDRQRTTPYVHLGRPGEYHMMMEVQPDAWDRVGAVVGGSRTTGGLERDWHEMIGDNNFVYMRFDSSEQMLEAKQRLQAFHDQGLFKNATGDSTWSYGRADEKHKHIDSASPMFVRVLQDRIVNNANYSDEAKQEFVREVHDTYLQQLPETSPLKASMFADNDVGASKDFIRTFGDRMTMSNTALVAGRASQRIAESLSGMTKATKELQHDRTAGTDHAKLNLSAYVEELKGRAVDLQTPVNSPVVDKMRAMTAVWRLGMSPAYMAMTMYQPWQVTLPFVGAKYGMVKTARAMAGNFRFSIAIMKSLLEQGWAREAGNTTFNKLSNLSDLQIRFGELKNKDGSPLLSHEQLDALEHLQWNGMLNFGQTQQIFRTDPNAIDALSKATRIATVMPHLAEISNRITGALTAFQMAREGGMSVEDAKKYSIQTVRNTDGDHSQGNVARKLGRRGFAGKITPLFVGFGQYDIQMTELLARTFMDYTAKGDKGKEARRAIHGVFVMSGLMAGALGTPFASLLVGAANAVGSLTGDDAPDAEQSFRSFVDGVAGKGAGEVLARGLPRALDFDMSNRSGYQDLAPMTAFLTDRRKWNDRIADGALNFLGPAVGALAGIATGAEALAQGDYVKAINDGLPAGVRNAAKAYRLSQYGYETQGGNNEVPVPVTGWNVFAQSLGLIGGAKAEQSEKAFAFNTSQQLLQRRQQVLRNAVYRAYEHGDYDQLGKLLQQNIDFAVQHPQFHADVGTGLKERAQQRAVGELSGTGVLASPHVYPYLQQYFQRGQDGRGQ